MDSILNNPESDERISKKMRYSRNFLCFFCSSSIVPEKLNFDTDPQVNCNLSLRNISRYMQSFHPDGKGSKPLRDFDFLNNKSPEGSVAPSSSSSSEWFICEQCSLVAKEFNELYHLLEVTRMRLDWCLVGKIQNLMMTRDRKEAPAGNEDCRRENVRAAMMGQIQKIALLPQVVLEKIPVSPLPDQSSVSNQMNLNKKINDLTTNDNHHHHSSPTSSQPLNEVSKLESLSEDGVEAVVKMECAEDQVKMECADDTFLTLSSSWKGTVATEPEPMKVEKKEIKIEKDDIKVPLAKASCSTTSASSLVGVRVKRRNSTGNGERNATSTSTSTSYAITLVDKKAAGNPLENAKILSRIFSFCSVSDLKQCRLVGSKLWLNTLMPLWREKAVLMVIVRKPDWMYLMYASVLSKARSTGITLETLKQIYNDQSHFLQFQEKPFKNYKLEGLKEYEIDWFSENLSEHIQYLALKDCEFNRLKTFLDTIILKLPNLVELKLESTLAFDVKDTSKWNEHERQSIAHYPAHEKLKSIIVQMDEMEAVCPSWFPWAKFLGHIADLQSLQVKLDFDTTRTAEEVKRKKSFRLSLLKKKGWNRQKYDDKGEGREIMRAVEQIRGGDQSKIKKLEIPGVLLEHDEINPLQYFPPSSSSDSSEDSDKFRQYRINLLYAGYPLD